MTTSKRGIDFIKSYEGCRLVAYKATPSERYYTIGYGHYGSDVSPGMRITPAEAEKLLKNDLYIFENAVNELGYNLPQSAYDALVSFAYNCGVGNLKKLTDNGRRTLQTIAEKMPLYCKANGTYLKGLERRRIAEQKMFLEKIGEDNKKDKISDLQVFLNDHGENLTVDGIAGNKTKTALNRFLRDIGVIL